MAKPPSYSVAPGDAANSRILSWGALLSVVTLAVVSMVLVFPRSDLLTILRRDTGETNRELTLAYLRNIIRTEPQDLGLRLLLAEKLLADSDLLGARAVLDEAAPLTQRNAKAKGEWDTADLVWWQARLRQAQNRDRASETTEAATELMARLKRRISTLASPAQVFTTLATVRELQAALDTAAGPAAKDTQEAQNIVRTLLARLLGFANATPAELTRGATLALAGGDFQPAAALYFAARRKTAQREAADQLLQQGVRALLASGQPLLAWQAATRETLDLPAGDPLYWWLAELALGAAQAKEAAVQLRQVVPITAGPAGVGRAVPFEKLQLAWDVFASSADLQAALVWPRPRCCSNQPAQCGWSARPRCLNGLAKASRRWPHG